MSYAAGDVELRGTDRVLAAVQSDLAAGRVVAIKGLGGYHLACDATDAAAVGSLRERKGRSDKPFAVMVADTDTLDSIAHADHDELTAILGPAHPIVLLRRRVGSGLADSVAPGNPMIGVMLPYTPLHRLLFEPVPGSDVEPPSVIVLTSGNRANEPICFRDDEARTRLVDLADAFCTHDRPIEVPCDDSVVRVIDGEIQPIRRSRGYAPVPVSLPVDVSPALGVGGELKNTCCVASGRRAWVGQHVGDMENLETLDAFGASVAAFTTMYDVAPAVLGVDRHPDYLTGRWARDRTAVDRCRVIEVQHHHAHVAALMAEHGLDGTTPVLGFAFDGTGFGSDAGGGVEIWGGEVLLADYRTFERVGHLAPLRLPGGDGAVRNPCRIAAAYLHELRLPGDSGIPAIAACDEIELGVVRRQVERNVGCVPTTSMGRLFDAVASVLGVRHRISYEGQAAIELEFLAETASGVPVPLSFGVRPDGAIDPRPVLAELIDAMLGGVATADLAWSFHEAVATAIEQTALAVIASTGYDGPVGLTGGVFQNALLTRLTRERLAANGIETLIHRAVPPNDGGLSLGQAVIAGVRSREHD